MTTDLGLTPPGLGRRLGGNDKPWTNSRPFNSWWRILSSLTFLKQLCDQPLVYFLFPVLLRCCNIFAVSFGISCLVRFLKGWEGLFSGSFRGVPQNKICFTSGVLDKLFFFFFLYVLSIVVILGG